MFETIVLGLDGSDGSKRAIPVAVEIAEQNNGKIVVAHIEEDVIVKGGGPIHATEDEIQVGVKKQAEELSVRHEPGGVGGVWDIFRDRSCRAPQLACQLADVAALETEGRGGAEERTESEQ